MAKPKNKITVFRDPELPNDGRVYNLQWMYKIDGYNYFQRGYNSEALAIEAAEIEIKLNELKAQLKAGEIGPKEYRDLSWALISKSKNHKGHVAKN